MEAPHVAAPPRGSRPDPMGAGLLDVAGRRLFAADGGEIPVTSMELDLLHAFAETPHRVLRATSCNAHPQPSGSRRSQHRTSGSPGFGARSSPIRSARGSSRRCATRGTCTCPAQVRALPEPPRRAGCASFAQAGAAAPAASRTTRKQSGYKSCAGRHRGDTHAVENGSQVAAPRPLARCGPRHRLRRTPSTTAKGTPIMLQQNNVTTTQRYARTIAASKRIRWDIDRDVIRGRRFDFGKRHLPTACPASTGSASSPRASARLLSRSRALVRQNLRAGGALHRRQGCWKVSHDHVLGDQVALEAWSASPTRN